MYEAQISMLRGSAIVLLLLLQLPRIYSTGENEITSELRHVLEAVTPDFQDNLRRAFNNEAVRRQSLRNRANEDVHALDDVLLEHEGNIIELRRLKFNWRPDFRVNNLDVNLRMLCIDTTLNLGNLRVDGEYETNNASLQKILPISHNGRVSFTFENVTGAGRVGLVIKEDSLVPQNYDVQYSAEGVLLRVRYFGEGDDVVENETSDQSTDAPLVRTFWRQLTETITHLLHRQLGAVIVEFSVSELLIDKDLELREYMRQQVTKANRLLDSLLCSAKDYLVVRNSRSVETPPFNVVFRGKPTEVHQGRFVTKKGYIQELSTLTRIQDMNLFENDERLVVYGYISMREFKHGYDNYIVEYMQTKSHGTIKSTIYRNRIFVKISLVKDNHECLPHLDSVQLRTLKDIDMDVSGLASLTWLTPQVGSWMVGNLRHQAVPVLESYITEAFSHALKTNDCIDLLIDQ